MKFISTKGLEQLKEILKIIKESCFDNEIVDKYNDVLIYFESQQKYKNDNISELLKKKYIVVEYIVLDMAGYCIINKEEKKVIIIGEKIIQIRDTFEEFLNRQKDSKGTAGYFIRMLVGQEKKNPEISSDEVVPKDNIHDENIIENPDTDVEACKNFFSNNICFVSDDKEEYEKYLFEKCKEIYF